MEEKDIVLLEREEVRMARELPQERKLAIGAELFDLVRENVKSGIRLQNPEITDNEMEKMLQKRLQMI